MDKIEDLLVNKGLYDAADISVEDLNEMQKYLSKSEYRRCKKTPHKKTDKSGECQFIGLFLTFS